MDQNQPMQKCHCAHHKMTPLFVILIGLTFLLGTMNVLSGYAVGIIWPLLLIILGITKWAGHSCKCCKAV